MDRKTQVIGGHHKICKDTTQNMTDEILSKFDSSVQSISLGISLVRFA